MRLADFWIYRALKGGRWLRYTTGWREATAGDWYSAQIDHFASEIDFEDHTVSSSLYRFLVAMTVALSMAFWMFVSTYL